MDTHMRDKSLKSENLPRPLDIAIIGETALEHLRQVAQRMQENITRLLSAEKQDNEDA